MKKKNFKSGYLAIFSAIIITAAIIMVAVSLGQASFLNRSNMSSTYSKNRSREAAYACVSTAFLDIVNNPSYAGGDTLSVASDTCKIVSVTASSTNKIIKVQSNVQNSFTNYQVTITTNPVSVIGWEELSSF